MGQPIHGIRQQGGIRDHSAAITTTTIITLSVHFLSLTVSLNLMYNKNKNKNISGSIGDGGVMTVIGPTVEKKPPILW